jgi:FKBP-type peptidyl-prolyl cis-trans isomerase (trigger factor)
MNIKHENVPGQVQEVVLEINKEDYAANVEAALKKQRRNAAIPGFRPGNAPMGIIKKMYEKSIIANEVDKLVSENMDKFFKDNDIKVIFEPLPVDGKSKMDFENPDNFIFAFEYAVAPEVNIDYTKLPAVTEFKMVPADEERQNYIKQLRTRHGEYTSPDTVSEDDSISVKYGDNQEGFLFLHDLTEEAQKEVIGKKLNDTVNLVLRKAMVNETTLSRFLKKTEKDLEADNDYAYDLTITHIGHMQLAEINDDFFKKAFPDGSVTTEGQLNAEADKAITAQYQPELDRQFMNDAIETLLDNVSVELPDDFMKRYIKAVQKEMTDEELEKKFNDYKRSFQWQILENKLVEGSDIQVKADDVRGYFRQYFIDNYFGNFPAEEVKERLDELVNQAMTNKENVKSVYDLLYDKKITEVLRSKLTIEHKEGDFKAFIDMIASRRAPKQEGEEGKSEEKAAEEAPKKTTKRKTTTKKAAAEGEKEVKEEKPAAPKKPRAKKTTNSEK